MIPGSLGSFDLIMVSGLVGLGIDKDQALSWLLVFRLFYYILPFCLGVVLFLKIWVADLMRNIWEFPKGY